MMPIGQFGVDGCLSDSGGVVWICPMGAMWSPRGSAMWSRVAGNAGSCDHVGENIGCCVIVLGR